MNPRQPRWQNPEIPLKTWPKRWINKQFAGKLPPLQALRNNIENALKMRSRRELSGSLPKNSSGLPSAYRATVQHASTLTTNAACNVSRTAGPRVSPPAGQPARTVRRVRGRVSPNPCRVPSSIELRSVGLHRGDRSPQAVGSARTFSSPTGHADHCRDEPCVG